LLNYWICVTDETNWNIIKKLKLWGVPKRNRVLAERVKIGDILVFYVKPKQVVCVAQVVSETFESNTKIFKSTGYSQKENFPTRVKIKMLIMPRNVVSFEDLVSKLGFIKVKEKWPAYLRRAMRTIPKTDYEVILASLKLNL
jgi:predicted RNA-binding protein